MPGSSSRPAPTSTGLGAGPVEVAWLALAPVKGLALVQLAEARLESSGLAEDRRFHLVDETGRLVNGKHLPTLVQVVPSWAPASGRLALRFPDGHVVEDEVAVGEAVTTSFYRRPVEGHLVAGPWSEALSAWAGRPLRLVRCDQPGVGVDRGPKASVSIVSTAALAVIGQAAGEASALDARRFRMTVGIEGVAAHNEDTWLGRRIKVGDAVVVPGGNVGRCLVTSADPESGVRDVDTLGALRAYRGDAPTTEPLAFGVWARVLEPGRVAVGSPVEVEEGTAASLR